MTSVGVSIFAESDSVVDDFSVHHNYFHGVFAKGISFGGDGEYKGQLYVHHNVIWGNTSDGGVGVRLEGKSDDAQNPRAIFYVWNNTIQAHEGARIGMSNTRRIDYSFANNLVMNSRRFIRDSKATHDETVPSTGIRMNNYYYPALSSANDIWFEGDADADPDEGIYNGATDFTWADYQTAVKNFNSTNNEDTSVCDGVDPDLVGTGSFAFRIDTNSPCVDAGVAPTNNVPYNSCTTYDFYGNQGGLNDYRLGTTPSMGAGEEADDTCSG